jgi:hypothetical protein
MTEDYMPAATAIELHLSYRGNDQLISSFAAALRDARAATGRCPDSGDMLDPQRAGNWLGAIGYLALTDQVGTTFRAPGATRGSGNIVEALRDFTTITEDDIDAVYALRNAFAHDFALVNLNPKRSSLQRHFEVHAARGAPLVAQPVTPWDGDLRERTASTRTRVNLWALADTVEGIVRRLVEQAADGTIEVCLPGGTDELLARYSFWIRTGPPDG